MSTASRSRTITVLNGPNLNLLGTRQPEIYGTDTLTTIEEECRKHLAVVQYDLDFRQSNSEGELVSFVQSARLSAGMLINAAGYTHTSVALLDALLTVEAPVIEVHLSSPAKRETFRHTSIIAPACDGVIAGFGALSYRLGLDALIALINASKGQGEG